MKVRSGFVSNSSSSSFIISTDDITVEQFKKIANYIEGSDAIGITVHTRWYIQEENNKVVGVTTGDDGQMKRYLNEIGIDHNAIIWEYS
jgi:hypothetical protein